MRLWSLDPKHLDRQGLLALWREGLLAKNVLAGKTKGYRNHPQLERFKETKNPLEYINSYLYSVYQEAKKRGYNFSLDKLEKVQTDLQKITINEDQLLYEFKHLLNKLKIRDVDKYKEILNLKKIKTHELFRKIKGPIEKWERIINNKK